MEKPLNQIISRPETRANLESRFYPKVRQKHPSECWPWIAKAKHPYGYGRMTFGRRVNLKAHQIAWALENGPIPHGAVIRHTCDNPSCCNPSHLVVGTQADNMKDAADRARASKPPVFFGEAHANHKLTDTQVAAIQTDGRSASVVAAEYGVCTKTIYRIRWKIRK